MCEEDATPPDDAPLAAVVHKGVADATIRALREAGVYDDGRRIREHDDDAIEVPVTAPPDSTDVLDVVRQVDPEPRVTGLADLLAERGFSDEEIDRAPSSWAVVGTVVLARFEGCPRPEAVGEALLELHGEADTVLDDRGIAGPHREPDVEVVAGAGDTETVHVEHGTRYALDLARVMFSPGNKAERARMGEVVEEDESVLDMFAGVGYFTLPMARADARVTAVERNPEAFRYLLENARLNEVADRIEPYRGDCREVVTNLPAESVDRVVMGYYDATEPAEDGYEYLDPALHAVRPGGVLHVHAAVPEAELWDRPLSRLQEASEAAGRAVEVLDRRTVKTHSEGVDHVVVDARVE